MYVRITLLRHIVASIQTCVDQTFSRAPNSAVTHTDIVNSDGVTAQLRWAFVSTVHDRLRFPSDPITRTAVIPKLTVAPATVRNYMV